MGKEGRLAFPAGELPSGTVIVDAEVAPTGWGSSDARVCKR
ncbi:hypothetical protein MPNT_60027 [Candidatus Methylacidithermus pantelleriae]|uniref:Uncharacterized protein n=1 Tax=Candidatus Methylacidithermus pantelleriae TaxID=2744239 RepID=A0A8J2FT95_9BACT|nr:hypothetical protein MPNT_60027 [Candidatus Methylacidithermus pantelleriae]